MIRHTLILIAVALVAAGCSYTLPDGTTVPREVYRTESNKELMRLATAADREYDQRNPIQQPPQVCQGNTATLGQYDLAFCAMAMATYNAQLQLREDRREAATAYAATVIDRQADERERKIDRWLNLGLTVYQTERQARVSSASAPRISVVGPRISSRGSGGGGGAGGGGEAGGPGSGGGAETGMNGDMIVNVNTGHHSQSGAGSASSFTPVLEYAEDLGVTSPVYAEGVQDNRRQDDNDNVGFDDVF